MEGEKADRSENGVVETYEGKKKEGETKITNYKTWVDE